MTALTHLRTLLPLLLFLVFATAPATGSGPRDLGTSVERTPTHSTYMNATTGLMIETGCSQMGDGAYVAYDSPFPGTPDVVTSAQLGFDPKMACPVNHTASGFTLSLKDQNGASVSNAWVLWIAIYPSEYDDSRTNLMIETGCEVLGHGDAVSYDLPFPGTPDVVTCAQWGSIAKMAAPVNHTASGFSLALKDHDGAVVDNAWVLWIAVYPDEYVDPATGLMIETGCIQLGHGDYVAYDVPFPTQPDVVTCGQWMWTPTCACPVNHTSSGFDLAMKDHNGYPEDNAWTLFLAVRPALRRAGDTNYDGFIDVNDLVNIIICWGDIGVDCPDVDDDADVNGDGTVDVNDLVLVIMEWDP